MFFQRSSKKRQQLSDQDLILKYRDSGDSAYVGELYERYSVQIYGICRRYIKNDELAKDAAMEVFEYLLKELVKYEIQNFKSWLARATSNFCLMRLRKNKTRDKHEDEFKIIEKDRVESAEDLHLEGESSERELELQRLEISH